MSLTMRSSALAATGLALTLTVAPACSLISGPVRASGSQNVTVPQTESGPMLVETRNGSVKIMAVAGRTSVDVTAQIVCSGQTQQEADQRLAATRLQIERDPQRVLVVKPVFDGGARSGDGASLTIEIPVSVAVSAADAAPAATGAVVEAITVNTSNGQVSVTGAIGSLLVTTSNGSVVVHDHAGPAKIASSNGKIEVANLGGALDARTSNGSVSAQQIGGPATVRSSNGGIKLVLAPQQAGPLNVATSNGSVSISVGSAFAGPVDFATSNARISIKDPGGRITEKKISKSKGRAKVGAGGEPSRIATSNGRIEFAIE